MDLTRRAALGGGVSVLFWGRAQSAGASVRLEAGPDGYNGALPGPLLRLTAGQTLKIALANKLDAPTSLLLPGGAFPGLGGEAVAPGASAEFSFAPKAAGFHLYSAYGSRLFGPLIVDEVAPPAVDLDAVVVFSGDETALRAQAGPAPMVLTASPGARVRLRLANACADYTIPLKASGAQVHIVAIDGQPSEIFEPRDGELPLCPSARFELLFDMGEGPFEIDASGKPALRIEARGERVAAKPAPSALPANPALPVEIALERALQVRVAVAGSAGKGFTLNGVGGAAWPAKPLFAVKRGAPVSLTLVNQTEAAQTLRIEGHSARQLHGLDDGWDPYWRDALPISPGKTVHAAFVAAAPGKWPLASASPAARAKGMAGWFQVV